MKHTGQLSVGFDRWCRSRNCQLACFQYSMEFRCVQSGLDDWAGVKFERAEDGHVVPRQERDDATVNQTVAESPLPTLKGFRKVANLGWITGAIREYLNQTVRTCSSANDFTKRRLIRFG